MCRKFTFCRAGNGCAPANESRTRRNAGFSGRIPIAQNRTGAQVSRKFRALREFFRAVAHRLIHPISGESGKLMPNRGPSKPMKKGGPKTALIFETGMDQ
jgi:hypothetical protein